MYGDEGGKKREAPVKRVQFANMPPLSASSGDLRADNYGQARKSRSMRPNASFNNSATRFADENEYSSTSEDSESGDEMDDLYYYGINPAQVRNNMAPAARPLNAFKISYVDDLPLARTNPADAGLKKKKRSRNKDKKDCIIS